MKNFEKRAVFPGSFDPITLGHLDLIKRSTDLVDTLYVLVADNPNKEPLFCEDERICFVNAALDALKKNHDYNENCQIISQIYHGRIVDFCQDNKVNWIIRGVRSGIAFEQEYEYFSVNKKFGNLDTLLLPATNDVSSSIVKELLAFNTTVEDMISPEVLELLVRSNVYERLKRRK